MRPIAFDRTDSPLGLPGDVRRLHLDRLSPADSERLAAALMGESGSPSAAQRPAAADAAGNPLFLDELARDSDHRRATGVPALLDDVIRERVVRLTPPSRALLEAVCLAGVAIPVSLAGDAAPDWSRGPSPWPPGSAARGAPRARGDHRAGRGGRAVPRPHSRGGRGRPVRGGQLASFTPPRSHTPSSRWWLARRRGDRAPPHRRRRRKTRARCARCSAPPTAPRARPPSPSPRACTSGRCRCRRSPTRSDPPSPSRWPQRCRTPAWGARRQRPTSAPQRWCRAAKRCRSSGGQPSIACSRGRSTPASRPRSASWPAGKLHYPRGLVAIVAGILWWRLLASLQRWKPVVAASARRDRQSERLDACMGVGYALAIVDPFRGAYFQALSVLLTLRLGDARRLPEAALALHQDASVARRGARTRRRRSRRSIAKRGASSRRATRSSRGASSKGCAGGLRVPGRALRGVRRRRATRRWDWLVVHRPGSYLGTCARCRRHASGRSGTSDVSGSWPRTPRSCAGRRTRAATWRRRRGGASASSTWPGCAPASRCVRGASWAFVDGRVAADRSARDGVLGDARRGAGRSLRGEARGSARPRRREVERVSSRAHLRGRVLPHRGAGPPRARRHRGRGAPRGEGRSASDCSGARGATRGLSSRAAPARA